jgi:hypothetical protein
MIMKIFERALIKGFEGLSNLFGEPRNIQQENGSRTILGTVANLYHPDRFEEAFIENEHRLIGQYCVGGSGTGKTRFIEHEIRQDILNDHGFLSIDFHGDLTRNILCFLSKLYYPQYLQELGQRLILIEPFNHEWAIGFNPLDTGDLSFAAILELVEVFERFWGNSFWGPRMLELLRAVLITLSANRLTLLEARPLLTNRNFRQGLIENVPFREVRDYWCSRYDPLSEKMQTMYREPVLNKLSAFVTDPSIYRIIGQRESTVDNRRAMDEKKWILLNLSKGQMKGNLRLLGTLYMTKTKHAALSRADVPEEERRPFYVFLDEVQNFDILAEDMETILSEARKFKLGLTMAHQNLDQLPRQLRASIMANVGTKIIFRVSHGDALQISSEMDPREKHLIERRLVDLGKREAFLKIKGQRPRILKVPYVENIHVSEDSIAAVKNASFSYWARPTNEIEREIEERRTLFINADVLPNALETPIPLSQDQFIGTGESPYEEGQDDW